MTALANLSGMSDEESDDAFHSAEENQDESDSETNDVDVADNDFDDQENSSSDDASNDDNEDNGNLGIDETESTDFKIDKNTEEDSDSDIGQSENDNDGSESADEEASDQDVNTGWADAMAKILKTNKPKKKKTLVLSRAKKLADVKKVKKADPGFEIVGDVKEEKTDQLIKTEVEDDGEPKIKKRREELPNLRVKPNILEKGREKILSKIATRGVVQLFNAVRQQQKDIESKIEKVGPLERKKEKVIKSLDKHKFLDMLMGQTKSEIVNKELLKKETKKEVKDEGDASTWSVFREDFMSGAKMKDWDKKDKATSDNEKLSELSDSD